DAESAITAENQRAHVARIHFVDADKLDYGGDQVVDRIRNIDAINLGGILQSAHVLARAKDRKAAGRGGGGNAFEDRTPVTGDVRKHVDLRVVPADEAAVVPDLFGGGDHE